MEDSDAALTNALAVLGTLYVVACLGAAWVARRQGSDAAKQWLWDFSKLVAQLTGIVLISSLLYLIGMWLFIHIMPPPR